METTPAPQPTGPEHGGGAGPEPGQASATAGFTSLSADRNGRLRLSCDPGAAADLEILHADENARILRYVIQPGERTGWHTHHLDFLTIHLSEGTMLGFSVPPGGCREDARGRHLTFTPGRIVPHRAPLEHDALNIGTVPVVLYEIEFSSAPLTVAEREPAGPQAPDSATPSATQSATQSVNPSATE